MWGRARTAGAIVAAIAIAFSAIGSTSLFDRDQNDPVEGERLVVVASSLAPPGRVDHIDERGDVVLDFVEAPSAGTFEVVGWRRGGGQVEVTADGAVVASGAADDFRPDVAAAHKLSAAAVGFQFEIAERYAASFICVTTPGAIPADGACNRPVLDIETHRVVAFYGVPGVPVLGTLGSGSATRVTSRLAQQAAPFAQPDRPVLPAFDMLATVAQAAPGFDGDYSAPTDTDDLREYLEAIRKIGGHVILDFQPGGASYMEQIVAVEDLLVEPDVHVALDPEWDMLAGQAPASVVGHTPASEVNAVAEYLDELIRNHRLPPKLLIVHQFQEQMIRNRAQLDPPDTVQLLLQMDGHGPPALKTGNYRRLADDRFGSGFKVFYKRDIPLMSPAAVLAIDPDPDLISYQ